MKFLPLLLLFFSSLSYANPLNVKAVYEFDSTNPNKYWWCGHAALSSVMKYDNHNVSMVDIHNFLLKNYPNSQYGTSVPGCADKYCSDINELLNAAKSLGMSKSVKVSVKATSADVLQKIKDAIAPWKRPLIIPGPANLVKTFGTDVGHFWIVTGFKVGSNPDQSTLYLKDVLQQNSPQMSILVGKFVYRIVQWRKKNSYTSSSFNFLIPKD